MPRFFTAYTKKEFIAMIERDMSNNDVVLLTTAVKEMETKPKQKLSNIMFQFPHEMVQNPDDIRSLTFGNIVTSVIIVKDPKNKISKEWQDGIKKGKGVFGFSINQ